jgi:hypothetical protein
VAKIVANFMTNVVVPDNSEIPLPNPVVEADVKKLRRKVFKPRKIPKRYLLSGERATGQI